MNEFGHLWIRVFPEEKNVRIIIRDDGRGFVSVAAGEEKEQKNRGIGLRYVKMSLDSFYGDQAVLTIDSKTGEGTEVQIVLPREM